jgi:flagellar protein FlbT
MNISLRRGERLFINGAVIRVDRKVNIELLNDVTFLLENHVMQPDAATTPLKRLYFTIQTMLMSPNDCAAAEAVAQSLISDLLTQCSGEELHTKLAVAIEELKRQRVFDALKTVRALIRDSSELDAEERPKCVGSQMEIGL